MIGSTKNARPGLVSGVTRQKNAARFFATSVDIPDGRVNFFNDVLPDGSVKQKFFAWNPNFRIMYTRFIQNTS